MPELYLRSWEVAKDSVNCAQDCPFGAESPAPCSLSPSRPFQSTSSRACEGGGAAQNPQQPPSAAQSLHPFPWGKTPAWGPALALGGHGHMPAGTGARRVSTTPARALAGVCGVAGPPLLRLAACCSAVPCGSPRAWVTGQFLTLCLSQGIRAEAHDL